MNQVKNKRESRRRKRIMIVVGILFILIGAVLIYWNISYSPFKSKFDKAMKDRINKTTEATGICTQEEINKLPELLRKHCEYIGLVGSPKRNVVNTKFKDVDFVFDEEKGTLLKMKYDLYIFSEEPFRSAYCTSSMKGIPFDGVDYCNENQEGGMRGTIGKAIQIFDTHNKQMYRAGLITIVAEGAALNPSILLSKYITYEEIDSNHVKATISYNGVTGTGIFTFSDEGIIKYFDSDEREEAVIDGEVKPIGWRAEYGEYTRQDESLGIKLPKRMKAVKVYPDREVVYFDSSDIEVMYFK